MVRSSKNSNMGFMSAGPKRRAGRKHTIKASDKAGTTVSASFATSLSSAGTDSKTMIHRSNFLVMGEKAVNVSARRRYVVGAEVASLDDFQAERLTRSGSLKSDDMWFGDPKNMPEEDLAFFDLET